MAEKYFAKFPLITYNNALVLNITERAIVTQDAFKNPYLFYKYDLSEDERPDQLADRYYNDQYMDWILYLGNKVTDPYTDWYLSEKDFHNVIVKKYDTDIYTLQSKTMFYRNNWYENEEKISVSEYGVLANNVHRYWQPYYHMSSSPAGYQRVQQDWIINTNTVIKYRAVATEFGTGFVDFKPNEIVDIIFDEYHEYTGKGQVLLANSTYLTLQHISGISLANSTIEISEVYSIMKGRESGAQLGFCTTESVANNISLDENIYWSAVSIYDYEKEKNEQKRSINVLDSSYSMKVSNELTRLLK